jgi:hypothetical protein
MRVKKKTSSRREIGAFRRYFYNTVAAPIYPHGCTNAVTTARLYSAADRRRLPVLRLVFETIDPVGIDGTGLRVFQAGIFLLDGQDFCFRQWTALSIVVIMDGPAVGVLLDVIHSSVF